VPAPDPAAPRSASPPDPFFLERAAAAAWPAAVAEEREGWLLRATPRVPHRRNNSALPLGRDLEVGAVEAFYEARGEDALIAVAPIESLGPLDADLERRGWAAEGATDVLVASAATVAAATEASPGRVEPVDPMAWPNEAVRTEVLARSRDEVLAFAEGQLGAVLCIRTGDVAGVFRLHVAPQARRTGVASRLLAACARTTPTLYAQVEADNEPAQRLFAKAGFARSHGYHYRRRR
jgi:ribosomal protein S18 acetylase RimI-like enzyme